jgi:hypothetical protein
MMKDSGGKQAMSFPRYGKLFRDFSTLWKNCFHAMENCSADSVTSLPVQRTFSPLPPSVKLRDKPTGFQPVKALF